MASRPARVLRSLRGDWLSGRWVLRRARLGLLAGMIGASVIGGGLVFVLAAFVVPGTQAEGEARSLLVNGVTAAIYIAIAVPIGAWLGTRRFNEATQWLAEERPPTPRQQLRVLRGPQRLAFVMGLLWLPAVFLFTAINLPDGVTGAIVIGIVVTFGGVTTCAVAFLLAERILREASARALQASDEARRVGPGVAMRAVLAWALTTGVPVLGIVLLGVAALAGSDASRTALALVMVCLGGIVLLVGFLATVVAARATADPVRSVTKALRRVEDGDLEARVVVYDGTEVGQLQAGFNRMVAGLDERERLRDLFGRHVGQDVARAALERGVDLGGETCDAAALFVDIVGSTTFAVQRPPSEVVAALNRFFAIVVEEVERHGGAVNKFEGDAALAVFGAPVPLDDAAGCALAAARSLAERLADELEDVAAGIGVSGGEVVAGNVGAAHRFEFTVIGDPVNEAARLTELAKEHEGRVVASAALVDRAHEEERGAWEFWREVELRGRDAPTRVAVPVSAPGGRAASRRGSSAAAPDTSPGR